MVNNLATPVLLDSRLGPVAKGKGRDLSFFSSVPQVQDECDARQRTFWRRAKWAPDGSHVLLQSEEHSLQAMRLHHPSTSSTTHADLNDGIKLEPGSFPTYQAPAPLLDAAWYPYATSSSFLPSERTTGTTDLSEIPAKSTQGGSAEIEEQALEEWTRKQTWCFLSSVRDVPVRLVDAESGQARTSYGVMDHVERFVAPTAMAFSPYGDRFYAGHDSYLTMHDLASPGLNTHVHFPLAGAGANVGTSRSSGKSSSSGGGRSTTGGGGGGGEKSSKRAQLRLKRLQRRKIAAVQQRGIVSSLAVCLDPGFHDASAGPAGGGADGRREEMVAVGSFSGNVGLYALGRGKSAGECCVAGWKEAQGTGISQLAFHPMAPHLLFVQSRRSEIVRVYDIRLLCGCLAVDFTNRAQATYGERTSGTLVAILHPADSSPKTGTERAGKSGRRGRRRTQQRLFFDVDPLGRWLCAGDANGTVRLWDVNIHTSECDSEGEQPLEREGQAATATSSSDAPPSEGQKSQKKTKTLKTLLQEYERRLVEAGEGDAQNSDRSAIQIGPVMTWDAHKDAVACVAFHPSLPILLTLGGSRSHADEDKDEKEVHEDEDKDEDEEHAESSDSDSSASRTSPSVPLHQSLPGPDPALKLWHLTLLDHK
ncbi:hypothetical protein CF319_g29 [Tilletia indica]|nr:hypothetical protein CF319_g29 [Tilletia indica]